MTQAFAWWSESGGPGKTTNCVNTAAAIARDGYDVVTVDLDPQRGSLTHYLGYDDLCHGDVDTTVMDVFFDDAVVDDIIVETEHYDLVPGHGSLSNFESKLSNDDRMGLKQFTVVREMVEELADEYDIILIDCQASLSKLTDNAIFAARNIMVPLELTPKGEASQAGLEDTVDAMHEGFAQLDITIAIAGCIPSRVGNAKIFEDYRDRFESRDVPVSPFSVPEHSLLKYTWDEKMDLFAFMKSDETRDLRPYEEHVPMAFKVIGRMMTGDYSYEDAVARWDEVKDQKMGDADPEALLDDETGGVEA